MAFNYICFIKFSIEFNNTRNDRMKNEEDIKLLLREGDNSAYKYLYDHYYVLLCCIAREYLKDHFLAATVVDDLIFHLWEKRTSIDITSSLKSYLVRAVRNRCINYLNQEREKRELSFSSIAHDQEEIIYYCESLDYPLATLLENELENEIRKAIERLPEECRRVFLMSRKEGKQYEQIAEELGISVNTVKYHMKNALARLSKDLSKYLMLLVTFWLSK